MIAAVFNEAERRDPGRERERVVLADGARHQLDVIHDQCDARGPEVNLLIDFVHVLEYAWGAAWCFFARTDPARREVSARSRWRSSRAEPIKPPTPSKRGRTRRNWPASGASRWTRRSATCGPSSATSASVLLKPSEPSDTDSTVSRRAHLICHLRSILPL
ncbi:hypothetical protein SNOUR_24090 [Streptomyces noursei ATCC 11455]|nr:hypothetical protein SNOUR_24090 [Streptomyces noursei ATCC 11455]